MTDSVFLVLSPLSIPSRSTHDTVLWWGQQNSKLENDVSETEKHSWFSHSHLNDQSVYLDGLTSDLQQLHVVILEAPSEPQDIISLSSIF